MSSLLFGLLKKAVTHIALRALRPEKACELLLNLAEVVVQRTDTKTDDRVVAAIRQCLED